MADEEGRFSIDPADQSVPGFHILVRDPHRPLAATALVEVYDLPPEEQDLMAKGFPILHAPAATSRFGRRPWFRALSGTLKGGRWPAPRLLAKIVVGGEHQAGGLSDVVATAQTDKDGKYQIALGGVLIMGNYAISAMAPAMVPPERRWFPPTWREAMAAGKPDAEPVRQQKSKRILC